MILPLFANETPSDRRQRFDRFVVYIDREVTKGNDEKRREAVSLVIHSREFGGLHDEHVGPLLELIEKRFKGESNEQKKGPQLGLFM